MAFRSSCAQARGAAEGGEREAAAAGARLVGKTPDACARQAQTGDTLRAGGPWLQARRAPPAAGSAASRLPNPCATAATRTSLACGDNKVRGESTGSQQRLQPPGLHSQAGCGAAPAPGCGAGSPRLRTNAGRAASAALNENEQRSAQRSGERPHLSPCSQNCASAFSNTLSSSVLRFKRQGQAQRQLMRLLCGTASRAATWGARRAARPRSSSHLQTASGGSAGRNACNIGRSSL